MIHADAKFPKRFLWGAATSAHQVEGGNHNQWTVWELENARVLATQAEYQYSELPVWPRIKDIARHPANYVSGMASDHYRRYREDFDIVQRLHMNAFRFSVEWSRIEPEEGEWNSDAIEHYRNYIAELKKREIEPVMTLFHFSLPVWFSQRGGFEKRSNVRYFERFAEKIVSEIGGSVRYIITINEPEVYATQSYLEGRWPPARQSRYKMWRVLNNLAYAHKLAAAAVRDLGGTHKVSVAKNSSYVYAGDDSLLSRLSTSVLQFILDDYFLKKVVKHCDFLGVNYYFSNRVYGYRVHNQNERLSDLGWDLAPVNLQFALERLHEKYGLPLLITENGIADMNDEQRKWWIAQTLVAMKMALQRGVRVIGYLHWSLLDNFEWAYGKWPRFGLVHVNYRTQERTIRPSARWFATIIKKLRTE